MKRSIFTLAIFTLAITIFSCNKDAGFISGEFIDAEKNILENARISARYQVNEEEVKLIIEEEGYSYNTFLSLVISYPKSTSFMS